MDGGWLLLLAVALRSPDARPFAVLLTFSWALSYVAIIDGAGRIDAYAVSLVFDVWALACGVVILALERPKRRGPWAYAVVALWAAWLAVQGVYWWNYHRGVDLGGPAFHAGRWIFTAQMAATAGAGLRCFWLEARGERHRLRRMRSV